MFIGRIKTDFQGIQQDNHLIAKARDFRRRVLVNYSTPKEGAYLIRQKIISPLDENRKLKPFRPIQNQVTPQVSGQSLTFRIYIRLDLNFVRI